jgi:FkbH-like protein
MPKEVKCIVWDLDNTIWDGTLLEDVHVRLKPEMKELLKQFDERGILHSIASKNNADDAMKKLSEFGIDHYFLYPQISWNAKSYAIASIQEQLNIGKDTIVFIDDQIFEREEVMSQHPEVECIDAEMYLQLASWERFNPRVITEDAANRRLMYKADIDRKNEEEEFKGPQEEFMAGLDLRFIISKAAEKDLKRVEELTIRTNQLNASGITYSYEELLHFSKAENYDLFVCELSDKFGSYGKIGIALVEKSPEAWCCKLLLMSCRVVSRGVGTVLLSHIMSAAKKNNVKLLADFKQTGRNRMMYVTFKFANFYELSNDKNGNIQFGHDLEEIPGIPHYISVELI